MSNIEKQESIKRRQIAKQRIDKLRQTVEQNIQSKRSVADLVREYVRQRPEVTVQIIQKWLKG